MSDLTTLQGILAEDSPDLEAERLILDATEMLIALMEREGVSRTDLADRIGKSKGHVSQLLNGGRNMTLRTLAEVAFALDSRVSIASGSLAESSPEAGDRQRGARVYDFKKYLLLTSSSPMKLSGYDPFLSMMQRRYTSEEEMAETDVRDEVYIAS